MSEEWRVEVELGDEEHGLSLGERLRSLDIDDEAREQLGEGVLVTRDGSRMFLYSDSEEGARAAERIVRQLVAEHELTAGIRVTRWHPIEEAWKDAAVPLPASGEEVEAERARRRSEELREAREEGRYEWEVRVDLPRAGDAFEFAGRLSKEDLPVRRHWKYLLVDAATREEAEQLAERIHSEAPEGTGIAVMRAPAELPRPGFVLFENLKPGIARDLGL
jgi:hypothetical protein